MANLLLYPTDQHCCGGATDMTCDLRWKTRIDALFYSQACIATQAVASGVCWQTRLSTTANN